MGQLKVTATSNELLESKSIPKLERTVKYLAAATAFFVTVILALLIYIFYVLAVMQQVQEVQRKIMADLSTEYADFFYDAYSDEYDEYSLQTLNGERSKRSIPEDNGGLKIDSETYKKIKQQGSTRMKLYDLLSSTAGVQHTTASPPTTTKPHARRTRPASRNMRRRSKVALEKRGMLKSLRDDLDYEGTSETTTLKPHRGRGRHRQRLVETFDEPQFSIIKPTRKNTIAAHFGGDTSSYVQGKDANFKGNGHLRHLDQKYSDWKPREWFSSLNMDQYFSMDQGHLTIKESGLYFVYAQIYYLDMHDINGYKVFKNNHPILQCTTMTHSKEPVMKSNTCYTAGVEHFNSGDKISIHDLSEGSYSVFQKETSFFGVIKLADARVK